MRNHLVIPVVTAAFCLAIATTAVAQRSSERRFNRVPDTGMVGVGAAVSFVNPVAPDLSNGPDLSVSVDRYFTPRLSLRAQAGGSWMDIRGHSFSGTANPFRLDGNVVYNWEGGKIHPHVTAGAGFYRSRFVEGNLLGIDNSLGANVGGGLEYFVSRRDTVTGEVLFHYIPGPAQGRLAQHDPRFWTMAIGMKRYMH